MEQQLESESKPLAGGCIGSDSEIIECPQEPLALTGEKPVSGEAGDCSYCTTEFIAERTDHSAFREVGFDELARYGKD